LEIIQNFPCSETHQFCCRYNILCQVKHFDKQLTENLVRDPPTRVVGMPILRFHSRPFQVYDLRINLNVDGDPIPRLIINTHIPSRSHTHPSHSQTSRLVTSSQFLGVPVPLDLVYTRRVYPSTFRVFFIMKR
jgi:hypothetical protein